MVLNGKFSLNSSTVVHSQNEFHPFFVALLFRSTNIRHITFIICMNCSFFDFEHSFRVRISVRIYYLISFRFQLSIHFMIAFIPFSLVSISSLPLNVATALSLCSKTPCLLQVYRCSNCFAIWFFDFNPNPEHKRIRYCWCKSLSLWQNKLKNKKKTLRSLMLFILPHYRPNSNTPNISTGGDGYCDWCDTFFRMPKT